MPKVEIFGFYVFGTDAFIPLLLWFVACTLKCTELIFYFQRVHRETVCIDETGKEFNALKLFTFCIHYLTTSLLDDIYNTIKQSVPMSDIKFVITIPAIWDDTARMFMIEASKAVRKIVLLSHTC